VRGNNKKYTDLSSKEGLLQQVLLKNGIASKFLKTWRNLFQMSDDVVQKSNELN
jgi:hypothetical protein